MNAPVRFGPARFRKALLATVAAALPLIVVVGSGAVASAASSDTTTGVSVALRALVVAVDSSDSGLATWTSQLSQIGVPYDTILSGSDSLTRSRLVRSDGVGRYNAVFLTTNTLRLSEDSGGDATMSSDEWELLWDYERDFQVRQVVLAGSPDTEPEDYCLREVSYAEIGSTAKSAKLTKAGATFFDYLNASAAIPVASSEVYYTSITSGCDATSLLTLNNRVIAATTTASDGRERAILTFTSTDDLDQIQLLGYGLVRWAMRGVFLGEQQHLLNVDIDDWFSSTNEMLTTGKLSTTPYRNTAQDVSNLVSSQTELWSDYPLADGFRLNLAYNAAAADLNASKNCSSSASTSDGLTTATYCNRDEVRWINHTYGHLALNGTDYDTTYREISKNLTVAQQLGLSVPATVLKTPEYSGLGTYHADPTDTINPPTDHGLSASNPALLQAATDLGVSFLHGNMSFASQTPSCFNCGIYHPLAPNLMIVPDWPTNIAYFATTSAEETAYYNSYYGPGGVNPTWSRSLSYDQIIDDEANVALDHVMRGSVYAHTMHVGNLRRYSQGKSVAFDWVEAVVKKYSSYYNVPLRNLAWIDLAQYVEDRTTHFSTIAGELDPVWNRATDVVTLTSSHAGSVFMTGADTGAGATYGTDVISQVAVTAGSTETVSVTPRS